MVTLSILEPRLKSSVHLPGSYWLEGEYAPVWPNWLKRKTRSKDFRWKGKHVVLIAPGRHLENHPHLNLKPTMSQQNREKTGSLITCWATASTKSKAYLASGLIIMWDNFLIVYKNFFFFGLFRAAPEAHGYSQARGPIEAVAACLHHSSQQCRILNPLSEARDQTCILKDASQVR